MLQHNIHHNMHRRDAFALYMLYIDADHLGASHNWNHSFFQLFIKQLNSSYSTLRFSFQVCYHCIVKPMHLLLEVLK